MQVQTLQLQTLQMPCKRFKGTFFVHWKLWKWQKHNSDGFVKRQIFDCGISRKQVTSHSQTLEEKEGGFYTIFFAVMLDSTQVRADNEDITHSNTIINSKDPRLESGDVTHCELEDELCCLLKQHLVCR